MAEKIEGQLRDVPTPPPSLSDAEMDRLTQEKWNRAHEVHNPGALSGSLPIQVIEHHQVEHLIRPGLVVLDIGVGLGNMCKHLHACDCVVDCLDVADEAFETVKNYARNFYIANNLPSLLNDEYDLAISMIVSQHMCERNLRDQIFHVYRSLKPGGIFSLHLAGLDDEKLNNLTGPIPYAMDGAMGRTSEYAVAMIRDVTGVTPTVLNNRVNWPKFKSYWYFVHIKK